jgi:hypothetical protein
MPAVRDHVAVPLHRRRLPSLLAHFFQCSDAPIVRRIGGQASRSSLHINLKTARVLGLTIPPGVLAIADERGEVDHDAVRVDVAHAAALVHLAGGICGLELDPHDCSVMK